jgi:hypothetical protein
LKESSFSHDLPEDGLARISGYLHTNKQTLLADSAVRTWIFDDRIIGEIVWTPILPGKNGDWKQHSLIRSIVAACEDRDGGTDIGTRRLEEWVGKSSKELPTCTIPALKWRLASTDFVSSLTLLLFLLLRLRIRCPRSWTKHRQHLWYLTCLRTFVLPPRRVNLALEHPSIDSPGSPGDSRRYYAE